MLRISQSQSGTSMPQVQGESISFVRHTMIRAIVALLLLTAFCANSVDIALALPPPTSANSVEKFVPSGWEIESRVSGDLNQDDKADTAIVLRKMDQKLLSDGRNGNPRILAVMFSSPAGHYDLISHSETLIPADDDPLMEDRFSGIDIRKGNLYVAYHYWASAGSWYTGNATLTFRFQEECFRLIGYDANFMHRATLDESNTSINYVTGKEIRTTAGNEDRRRRTSVKSNAPKPLRCMREIGNAFW